MSLRNRRLVLFAASASISVVSSLALAGDPPATALRSQPEIRRGNEMGGTPEQRANRYYGQLLQRIEPSGSGDITRLPAYLDFFRREFIEDRRLFATNITGTADSSAYITLHGFTEFEEHPKGLTALLERLGFEVIDAVDRLPSKELGDTPFAVVKADSAFIYDKSATPRENLTQCIQGDKVILLAPADNGYFLCHGPDGYVGYIDGSAVQRVTASAFDMPADWVPKDPRVEKAISRAMEFIGTKYVWGGTTKDGIDCSGLIYRSFMEQGISLPRDADQQSLVGRMVATRWHHEGLRRGDLLYFIGRRGTIHHTAIYLGDEKFLEAAEPVVRISSFRKGDPEYAGKRDDSFCFAKRMFD